MTTPSRELHPDPIVSRRRGPRHRFSGQVPSIASEEFRAHTEGLSNRLPLPSLEAMRAGTVLSPHGLVRRYLLAARRIGLPKEWALKFSVFVSRTIESAWPMEQTPLRVLEEKAMRCEAQDDLCEKRHALESNAITLRERIQTQTAEIVADQLCLARLERELEDVK
jgi:hypothetical protein